MKPIRKEPIDITAAELKAALAGKEPAAIPYLPATEEIAAGLLARAEGRAQEILHMPSIYPTSVHERCYYVSNDGDDENDGRSEESPWRTCRRVHEAQDDGSIAAGDAVFFRRGSHWMAEFPAGYHGDPLGGECALKLKSGVTYSAYDYGPKPLFTNCLDASSPECWAATEYPNVWRYTLDAGDRSNDVGTLVIDEGKFYAIKVVPHDPNHPYLPDVYTQDNGMVTNLRDVFHSGGTLFTSPGCLINNLEFLHDYEARTVYLYWDGGNPGESFGSILLTRRGNILRCDWETKDVVIDNLAIKYGGSHGIFTEKAENVLIQNCIIGWIGGSFQERWDRDQIRYGNAVENWGSCRTFTVRNCIVYQCYDAGLTTQFAGDTKEVMYDVNFLDNMMAWSNSPLELWHPGSPPNKEDGCRIEKCRMTGNFCLYSGYQFGHQRPTKNGSFGCLGGGNSEQYFVDTEMTDNFFLYTSSLAFYARCFRIDGAADGIMADRNVYLMSEDAAYTQATSDPITRRGERRLWPYNRETLSAIAALGIDTHSTFYYFKGSLYPAEDQGVYIYPGIVK